MKKYYHKKLIRDKIPELIQKTGGSFETKVLSIIEFEKELKKKLIEESQEIVEASPERMLNELADVLELIKSIGVHYGIKFRDIEKYQLKKNKERGGFLKRLFLIWSTGKSGQ
ncbi:nucleoside triphosphate pyrophosphohydrolase [Candidatus Dojkabacteria bacterium]|nr:nucleoside triphosphate pyrophosphohydrolase [Candidatus Dojkabacteria bacterium]